MPESGDQEVTILSDREVGAALLRILALARRMGMSVKTTIREMGRERASPAMRFAADALPVALTPGTRN
jgi:hypothetical protein